MSNPYSSKNEFEFDINKFTAPAKQYFIDWVNEAVDDLKRQPYNVKRFTDILLDADRIFLSAKGRSGLVASYAGVRYRNARYEVFEVGHHLTPPIGSDESKKDVLYCMSASGKTRFVVASAEIAKEVRVPVLVITATDPSHLSNLATEKIVIRGRTKDTIENEKKLREDWEIIQLEESQEPLSYLGSKSEMKFLYINELIVNYLFKRKGIREIDAKKEHQNIEF